MADGSLDMISQAGEPGTARVASRRSPQENRETSGSTQAPGEQSAPAASPSRLLIATGLGITAFTLYLMTGFTSDVSQGTLVRTGLLQGFGIGFVFVALGTVAFGTLPPALRTQRTGLFNLMRNIGASIGISMMGYLLVRNSAVTQAGLVEHVTPFRQVIRDHAQQLGLAIPGGRAALAQLVTAQAETVAFIDNFKLMMFVSLLAIPLVMLVQRSRRLPGKEGQAGTLAEA